MGVMPRLNSLDRLRRQRTTARMAPAIKHIPTIDINVARTMTVVLLPELELEDPFPLSSEEAVLLGDALTPELEGNAVIGATAEVKAVVKTMTDADDDWSSPRRDDGCDGKLMSTLVRSQELDDCMVLMEPGVSCNPRPRSRL